MKKIVNLFLIISIVMLAGVGCEKRLPEIEKVDVVENIAESINKGISKAVLVKNEGKYSEGEFVAEGHETIEIEEVTENYKEEEGKRFIKVYSLVTYGKYNVENGVYNRVTGSEVVPVAMTFSKNTEGVIDLINYQIPDEKKNYEKEVKKIFPENICDDIFNMDASLKGELLKQEMKYFD